MPPPSHPSNPLNLACRPLIRGKESISNAIATSHEIHEDGASSFNLHGSQVTNPNDVELLERSQDPSDSVGRTYDQDIAQQQSPYYPYRSPPEYLPFASDDSICSDYNDGDYPEFSSHDSFSNPAGSFSSPVLKAPFNTGTSLSSAHMFQSLYHTPSRPHLSDDLPNVREERSLQTMPSTPKSGPDNTPKRGRKKGSQLEDDVKKAANETREIGSCCRCRGLKVRCEKLWPNANPEDEYLWLKEYHENFTVSDNPSLVVNLRIIASSIILERWPVVLRPAHDQEAEDRHAKTSTCDLSGLHKPQMDNFVNRFSELASEPTRLWKVAGRGDIVVFDMAKKCISYFIVLRQLPYASCERLRRATDSSITRKVVGALFSLIVDRFTSTLKRTMQKIISLFLAKAINHKVPQDNVLLALAMVVRLTEEMTELQLPEDDSGYLMFSVLSGLSEAAKLRVIELRSLGVAVYDSLPPMENFFGTFEELTKVLMPDASGLSFQIAYSISMQNLEITRPNSSYSPRCTDPLRSQTPDPTDLLWASSFPQDSDDKCTAGSIFKSSPAYPFDWPFLDEPSRTASPLFVQDQIDSFNREHPPRGLDTLHEVIDPKLLNQPESSKTYHPSPPRQNTIIRRQTSGPNDMYPSNVSFFSKQPETTHGPVNSPGLTRTTDSYSMLSSDRGRKRHDMSSPSSTSHYSKKSKCFEERENL